MTILRKALIVAAALALVLVGGLAGLYAAGLAINRHDRPPSAAALEFVSAARDRPPVADRDNGYIYALGLQAPPAADPLEVGSARAAWARRLEEDPALRGDSDPYPPGVGPASEAMRRVARDAQRFPGCDVDGDPACFEALESASDEIEAALAQSSWALARYRKLLDYPAWREVYTYDRRGPVPQLADIERLRRLLFLEAWTLARRGDSAGVKESLERDSTFWRRALADSGVLLTKMAASSFIREHFIWSNVILKRLPPELVEQAIPDSWRVPLSDDERSFRRVVVGEWRFEQNLIVSLKTRGSVGPPPANPPARSLREELSGKWSAPFLQPQDFANRNAERLARFAAAVEVPYAELPAAFAALKTKEGGGASRRGFGEAVYDWLGHTFLGDLSSFTNDAESVADLEGVRRAALLVAELRSAGVSQADVAAAIAGAELRNPYTGDPFAWDADKQAVVFAGQSRTAHGRVALRY